MKGQVMGHHVWDISASSDTYHDSLIVVYYITTYDFFQLVETGEDAVSSTEKPCDWPKPIWSFWREPRR
jgi:hypothetical protein